MPAANTLDTVIFDLDGTLIDTEPSAAAAIRDCFAAWGITPRHEDADFVTGRTWSSAFDYLFKKYRIPVPAEEASRAMMRRYRERIESKLEVVPGGAEAVRNLAGKFRLGLVSGSGRAEILWALGKLGITEHFDVILGAEDYPRSKPEPDGYLKALNLMNSKPERGLVFEDSHPGIASARAAGLWVVAITGTNHLRQDTSAAHHHIADLTPVNPEWLEKLASRLATQE